MDTAERFAVLRRLQLQPGDTIVVQTALAISSEQRTALSAYVMSRMPGHAVLVLDRGVSLSAVGAAGVAT